VPSLEDERLYVKVRCVTCHGTRAYSAGGHHDPTNPGKWGACPYCDQSGTMYIEASVNVIVDCLAAIPAERRDLILQRLSDKISEEN
jgi:hypothetical protein